MAKIKYTKNELKKQKDALKRFTRYLPTLELKKKQLQTEINKIKSTYEEVLKREDQFRQEILSWIEVFGEDIGFDKIHQLDRVETETGNIAGVDIPAKKRIVVALTYIYGIGRTASERILKAANIEESLRAENLSEGDLARIREIIDSQYKVEGDLRREVQGNIKRLKDLGAYRGMRHIRNLPCRGQRTHTNARTRKGRPRVAVAGRKEAPAPK